MFKTLRGFTDVMLVLIGLALVAVAALPIGFILWILGAVLSIGAEAFFIAFVGLWFGILIGYILASDWISERLKKLYFYVKLGYYRSSSKE